MSGFFYYFPDPSHKKIGISVLLSRIMIIPASAFMTVGALFIQSITWLGVMFVVSAILIFCYDIGRQTRSAVDIEKRIRKLEKTSQTPIT